MATKKNYHVVCDDGSFHLTVTEAETIVCIIKGVNYILVPLYLHEIRQDCGVLNNYKL